MRVGRRASAVCHRKEKSFFSEEKKQKTFIPPPAPTIEAPMLQEWAGIVPQAQE
jgi:hypothetical protein